MFLNLIHTVHIFFFQVVLKKIGLVEYDIKLATVYCNLRGAMLPQSR
jgi:hypothetical protein